MTYEYLKKFFLGANYLAAAFFIAIQLNGCSSSSSNSNGTVDITDTSITLDAIGSSHQFVAIARDSNGILVNDVQFNWSSSDNNIATIDSNGIAFARAEGEVEISATINGTSAVALVTVLQLVANVDISPNSVTLNSIGATQQFTAAPRDANGHIVENALIVWESSNPTIVTIDADGVAHANSFGEALLYASTNGVSSNALFNVVVPGVFTMHPEDWQMPVDSQVQFSANFNNPEQASFEWSVNGIPGGSAESGTIGINGTYLAPSKIPANNPVIVRAALSANPNQFVEAPITITSGSEKSRINWDLWTPRVAVTGSSESLLLEINFSGYPTLGVERPGQPIEIPKPLRTGIYSIELPSSEVLEGYASGDLHNFVGYLTCSDCERISKGNIFVNVNDGTVVPVSVVQLADDMQASDYVVNIRYDELLPPATIPVEVLHRFYSFFPDDYDFVAVIEQVNSFNNRTYRGVQNNVEGIGSRIFNNSATYGSQGVLKGLIDFPISTFFDAGSVGTVHEIGHQWMVHLDNAVLWTGTAHWPISDLARGIMGYSGIGGQGLTFPYEVQFVSGNTYRLVRSEKAYEFNDLELYLMGLIPDNEVMPHVVFRDQNMPTANGSQGETDNIFIQDIIAANGPRIPDYMNSQKNFRLATVVLSHNRLLSADEMAFFDHMAARGEARTDLHFTSGFLSGSTKPFYLATGARATLTTRLMQ